MRQKQKPTSGIESTLRYSNRISEQFKYESSQSPEDIPRAASISEVSESERITQKISAYESNNDSMFRYQGVYKPIRRVIKPQRLTQEAADQKQFWQLLAGVNSEHQPSETNEESLDFGNNQVLEEDRQSWLFEDERRQQSGRVEREEEDQNQSGPIDVPYQEKTSKKEPVVANRSKFRSKSRRVFQKIQIKRVPSRPRIEGARRRENNKRNVMERTGLVFIPFPRDNSQLQEDRKYPLRQTRFAPMKFWLNEKVDYKKRGIFVSDRR